MTLEEVRKSSMYIAEDFRLPSLTSLKKRRYFQINCEVCDKEVEKIWSSNSWKFTCNSCSHGARSTNEFINEANIAHNSLYSYTDAVYTNSNTKLVVTCPSHGNWSVRASDHLDGGGCPTCSHNHRREVNSNSIIEWEKRLVGSAVIPIKLIGKTKILLNCTKHNNSYEYNKNNLHTSIFKGCNLCIQESRDYYKLVSRRLRPIGFKQLIPKKLTNYRVSPTKRKLKNKLVKLTKLLNDKDSEFICHKHGNYIYNTKQAHLTAHSGCQHCLRLAHRRQPDRGDTKPVELYYIYLPQLGMYKLGMTSQGISKRIVIDHTLIWSITGTFNNIADMEHNLHIALTDFRYSGSKKLIHTGSNELYHTNVLPTLIKAKEILHEYNRRQK